VVFYFSGPVKSLLLKGNRGIKKKVTK